MRLPIYRPLEGKEESTAAKYCMNIVIYKQRHLIIISLLVQQEL